MELTLVTGSQVVRESSLGRFTTDCTVDLLAMVGGFGCVTSSMITLMVRPSISHPIYLSLHRRYSSLVHTSKKPAIATANVQ